jgi:hypothetical protein
MSKQPLVTIGFSSHRVEVIPFAKSLMEKHDVIITEESQNSKFEDMLSKKISIDEYLSEIDSGFPEFSRRMYKLLMMFYQRGKTILQVEPYMERLMRIHEMFFEGKKPSDVLKILDLKEVYETEKKATSALLHFYESSMGKSFEEIIKAVKKFAYADAERFRLRDRMRAEAISKILPEDKAVYIEAGAIHIYFEKSLRQRLRNKRRIKTVFLLEPVVRKLSGNKQVIAPGDILTERYIFRRRKNEDYENLLAARALIYIKILEKEEMIPSRTDKTPHIKDEIRAIELANKLTYEQCEEIYRKIRFLDRQKALEIVQGYVSCMYKIVFE